MKNDISAIGNALVDTVFKVEHSLISELGLEIDQMTLSSAEEHAPIIERLIASGAETVSDCGGSATNSLVAASSFAVVVGFAAFILIWNTIRLTSYAKREEIEIMKIVGASSLYIRFPFILEAIMESLIGAVVAVGLGVGLMNYISDSSISESIFS